MDEKLSAILHECKGEYDRLPHDISVVEAKVILARHIQKFSTVDADEDFAIDRLSEIYETEVAEIRLGGRESVTGAKTRATQLTAARSAVG